MLQMDNKIGIGIDPPVAKVRAKAKAKPKAKPKPKPKIAHTSAFISTTQAETILATLLTTVPWQTFALSSSRKVFQWSGRSVPVVDSILTELMWQLEQSFSVKVQGIFLNLYRDGKDYCPYHRDLYQTDVYTLSLGATRDLLVKPDRTGETLKFTLRSGDLYYMAESLHKDHRHSVPKRAGVSSPRISIVFFTTPLSV